MGRFQYVHGSLSPACLATDVLLTPDTLLDEGQDLLVRFHFAVVLVAFFERWLTHNMHAQGFSGAPFYRPPEALSRSDRTVSPSLDIFAAGAVMFEAFVQQPFISHSDGSVSAFALLSRCELV